MELRSKYNIGQEVFRIADNKVESFHVKAISVKHHNTSSYSSHYQTTFCYYRTAKIEAASTKYNEYELFETQEAALRSMVEPSTFNEIVKKVAGDLLDPQKKPI